VVRKSKNEIPVIRKLKKRHTKQPIEPYMKYFGKLGSLISQKFCEG